MMNHDGGPAFPVAAGEYGGHGPEFGMTLRDYFAAKALPVVFGDSPKGASFDQIAEVAYTMADAMIKARSK